jgi:methylated-DNA-protein-cysteine methyltransferase-like protein
MPSVRPPTGLWLLAGELLAMTDLNDRIYALVRQIPRGRVTTYGQLAEMCGVADPRDVGSAMNVSHGIPWQRVINSRGGISIKGATGDRQRVLLEQEGVAFDPDGRVDMAEYGWVPQPDWLEANGYRTPPPLVQDKKRKAGDPQTDEGEQLVLF